jgi:hypothetical protein
MTNALTRMPIQARILKRVYPRDFMLHRTPPATQRAMEEISKLPLRKMEGKNKKRPHSSDVLDLHAYAYTSYTRRSVLRI